MTAVATGTVRGGVASRVKALAPSLERLFNGDAWYVGNVWRVGTDEIRLSAWECAALSRAARQHSVVGSDDGCHLVAQGVALLDTCAQHVAALLASVGTTEQFYECQAALMLDAAIGTALMQDCQGIIDRSVAAGRLDEARHFTEFRHKMRRVVAEARKGISESEQAWADGVAASLAESDDTTSPVEPAQATPPVAASAASPFDEARVERRAEAAGSRPPTVSIATSGGPSPLAVLLVMLVALMTAWVLVAAGRRTGRPTLEPPRAALVPHGDAIVRFVSRPPSLFVDVDPVVWDALTRDRQETLVRGVLGTAPDGYRGVLVRTTGGRALVGWHAGHGLRWIESDEDAPRPPG